MAKSPTLSDIYTARRYVYRHLTPTPLRRYAGINKLVGTEIWIKHENHNPTGSFKVRGGINLAARLSDSERKAGLFTASTGNHGQSIAYAAMIQDIKATIAVPVGANPSKVLSMQELGADVVFHGADFDTAREWITEQAHVKGGRFVTPTETLLIEGVGTYAIEIIESLPQVDTIIVPVGAGSGICGTAIVAKSINKDIQVIGVQSAQAPAMQLSWSKGRMIEAEMRTSAEGLATRVPFENTQSIMRELLDDFVLVEDSSLEEAVILLMKYTHNLVEEAGAASLAAALSMKAQLQNKNTVLILSGGNQSLDKLRTLLLKSQPEM